MTRLNGGMFGVNPDLIQRVDSAPDTILTLIDGTKLIITESMDEVIARVNEHRARILARSREIQTLAVEPVRSAPYSVPDPDDEHDEADPDVDPDSPPTASTGKLRRVR